MPVLYTTLEETQKTILRSCFFSIIKDVVNGTGIPADTIIAMHHGVEVNKTDNRTNVSNRSINNLPATVSQRRVIATIIENYDEDSLSSTTVSQKDVPPIFVDPDIDVSVFPVYVKSSVTIEIEYSCGSKTEAQRVRDDIRVKLSQSRNIFSHEVEYNILIPAEVQDFIADVHDLKSRLFPQELGDYFMSNSTKQVHRITDMVNESNAQLAIFERQVRIVGIMDFSPEPPPIEQNNETNTYKLTIPYKFTMDVPRGMCMSYPAMICNRLMPSSYLQFVEDRKVKTREEYSRNIQSTASLGALAGFEANRQLSNHVNTKLPLNLPLFDEYHKRVSYPGYVITTTLLTDVNEDDKRSLINLRELDDFYMDKSFLNFLVEGERNWIVSPCESVFFLGVSQKGKHHDNSILSIDAQLNVASRVDLSLVRPVRITLSLCLDITVLSAEALKRLIANKDMYLLYLAELLRGIRDYTPEFSRMGVPENTLYRHFILVLIDALNREEHGFICSFFNLFKTNVLMTQTLIGYLKNNYPSLYAKLTSVLKACSSGAFDLDKHKYNDVFGSNATGVENYAMRSVMNYARVAHRRTNLDDRDIPAEFNRARYGPGGV